MKSVLDGIFIFKILPFLFRADRQKKEEYMMMTLEEVKKLAEDKTYGRIPLTTV